MHLLLFYPGVLGNPTFSWSPSAPGVGVVQPLQFTPYQAVRLNKMLSFDRTLSMSTKLLRSDTNLMLSVLMLLSHMSLPVPSNMCQPGQQPEPGRASLQWQSISYCKKCVIAEHFINWKFGMKAYHFIVPALGSPMSITKICAMVTITLGFYAMLKVEAQRNEMRAQLPSTPGEAWKYTHSWLLVHSCWATLIPGIKCILATSADREAEGCAAQEWLGSHVWVGGVEKHSWVA